MTRKEDKKRKREIDIIMGTVGDEEPELKADNFDMRSETDETASEVRPNRTAPSSQQRRYQPYPNTKAEVDKCNKDKLANDKALIQFKHDLKIKRLKLIHQHEMEKLELIYGRKNESASVKQGRKEK